MGNWKSRVHSPQPNPPMENIVNPKEVFLDDTSETPSNETATLPYSDEQELEAEAEAEQQQEQDTPVRKPSRSSKSISVEPLVPTKEATEHLNKELQKFLNSKSTVDGFRIEPVEDNIFKWNVYLFDFDPLSQIKQDLELYCEATGKENVLLEVNFPYNYPCSPPFIRVVYPRFHQYTGHITTGGSVCIKDLTTSGWSPKNELFQFFVMVRNLLVEGGALINMEDMTDYTHTEATEAFLRVAKAHGWIPAE